MYKEIIIIIVVIALVVSLDIITNNYTKASVQELSKKLNNLRVEILNENLENAEIQMKKVKDEWKEKYEMLAYYIEHDELEKVETELTRLAAYINVGEYKEAINELDTAIFILKHIEQKEELDIISIF